MRAICSENQSRIDLSSRSITCVSNSWYYDRLPSHKKDTKQSLKRDGLNVSLMLSMLLFGGWEESDYVIIPRIELSSFVRAIDALHAFITFQFASWWYLWTETITPLWRPRSAVYASGTAFDSPNPSGNIVEPDELRGLAVLLWDILMLPIRMDELRHDMMIHWSRKWEWWVAFYGTRAIISA